MDKQIMDKMIIREIHADIKYVGCPKCDYEIEGWFGDPRGTDDTCDHCGTEFEIMKDAEIIFD